MDKLSDKYEKCKKVCKSETQGKKVLCVVHFIKRKRDMAYRWLFYKWTNKVLNTESVKKVCVK